MGRKIPAINFPTFLETKSKKGGVTHLMLMRMQVFDQALQSSFWNLTPRYVISDLAQLSCLRSLVSYLTPRYVTCAIGFSPKVVGVFNSVPLVGFCVPLTMRCLFYHYADHLSSCLFLDLKLIHLI